MQEDHIGGGVVVPCKRQTTHEEAEYSFCKYPKMLPHLCFFAVHRNQIAFSCKIAGFFSLRFAMITRGYYYRLNIAIKGFISRYIAITAKYVIAATPSYFVPIFMNKIILRSVKSETIAGADTKEEGG